VTGLTVVRVDKAQDVAHLARERRRDADCVWRFGRRKTNLKGLDVAPQKIMTDKLCCPVGLIVLTERRATGRIKNRDAELPVKSD
jgi:hypothetical protein